MAGIQGRQFQDYSVGIRENGSTISEYDTYKGEPPLDKSSLALRQVQVKHKYEDAKRSIGSLLLDATRSVAGLTTNREIAEAKLALDEAATMPRADQQAAHAIAMGMKGRSDVEIRKVLPGIGDRPIPQQEDMRALAIGRAAIDEIHRNVDHGNDHRVSPEIGRAARIQALYGLKPSDMKGPLSDELDRRSKDMSDRVRNYLSPEADILAKVPSTVANLGPQRHAARTARAEWEMAEARAGLVPARELVVRAAVFDLSAKIPLDRMHGRPVRMPNLENANAVLSREQRNALVMREMQPRQEAAADRTAPTFAPASAQAIHAARGAAMTR